MWRPDRTGPDTGRSGVFRVQQQRERGAASVMTRPGKRSFQAALIFLSVAQLTAGKRANSPATVPRNTAEHAGRRWPGWGFPHLVLLGFDFLVVECGERLLLRS